MFQTIHHIGNVVQSINDHYKLYQQLGYRVKSGFEIPQKDREQDVLVGVLVLDGLYLELLEPLSNSSPVSAFSKNGGGLHHICYSVKDLSTAVQEINSSKLARQITKCTTSVWDGKKVVFFMTRSNNIFELIEL